MSYLCFFVSFLMSTQKKVFRPGFRQQFFYLHHWSYFICIMLKNDSRQLSICLAGSGAWLFVYVSWWGGGLSRDSDQHNLLLPSNIRFSGRCSHARDLFEVFGLYPLKLMGVSYLPEQFLLEGPRGWSWPGSLNFITMTSWMHLAITCGHPLRRRWKWEE